MVDPTTANTSMSVPIRGSDVGTWDTPVNGNFNILDSMFGSVATIALTSAPVTLTTSQAQCSIIRLTGTLNSNVAITMAGISKFWTIDNQLLNSPSSFCATLVSTSGTSVIGCPPGTTEVFYDGSGMNYKNMGKFGEYWDYAGNVVPSWVTASTKPPWLNCNGTTFSSATYPILANFLGTTTLPDARGSARYTYNAGTSRITTANAGLDGDTLYASRTTATRTLLTANLPAYTPSGSVSVSIPNNIAPLSGAGTNQMLIQTGSLIYLAANFTTITGTATFTGSAQGGTSTPFGVVGTGYVGGITMIRAA